MTKGKWTVRRAAEEGAGELTKVLVVQDPEAHCKDLDFYFESNETRNHQRVLSWFITCYAITFYHKVFLAVVMGAITENLTRNCSGLDWGNSSRSDKKGSDPGNILKIKSTDFLIYCMWDKRELRFKEDPKVFVLKN